MLNRCVMTVRAKQPFFDWLKGLPSVSNMTLEQWNEDGVAYLLPEVEEKGDDLTTLIPLCFDMIFERELAAWRENEKDWPAKRDLALFLEWFEPQLRSVVIDLVDAPLEDDEA